MGKKITPRNVDYSKWYNDIISEAGLAESSDVRGCMVIKPYGFAIWELMKSQLDIMFKETGHENAYFPLFVPKSLFEAEEKNAEGFAKECAVVTHYRLKNDSNNKGKLVVDPDSKLEEELIVRPTSEAIIWKTYKRWIQSYRDLPILINQWANVVRWEMRTRLFLRTAEFLWQEGHTAHATKEEALKETKLINNIYSEFAEKYMAMPVIQGSKSESERFAGAEETLCIEALMQDGKALQAGTSHFLGQNFAKAFDVKFADRDGQLNYVWATSWGVSSRLMGALIMTHSDDRGLVLPPKLAPHQVIFVPIYKNEEQLNSITQVVEDLRNQFNERGISSKFDNRDTKRPGEKFAQHEIQGVPVRITIGPKDLEKKSIEIFRRDTLEKQFIKIEESLDFVSKLLDEIQKNLFDKAKNFRDNNITEVENFEDFKITLENKGGFISAHWDGTDETENKIKDLTKATIRCIPEENNIPGKCVFSGNPSSQRVLFAKAY